jgi:hypothetical protein
LNTDVSSSVGVPNTCSLLPTTTQTTIGTSSSTTTAPTIQQSPQQSTIQPPSPPPPNSPAASTPHDDSNHRINDVIVNNLNHFLQSSRKGRHRYNSRIAQHAILTGCTHGTDDRMEEVRKALGVGNSMFYNKREKPVNIDTYVPLESSKRNNTTTTLKNKLLTCFVTQMRRLVLIVMRRIHLS